MTTIENLDDRSLLQIYDELSIQDVWTSGRVCVRLNGARRNCAQVKRELVLHIGKYAKYYEVDSNFPIPEKAELINDNGEALFPDNRENVQLQIYSFPLDFVRLLIANFANLTSLTLSTRVYSKELDSSIHLLEQFNRPEGTLQSLKLYAHNEIDQVDQNTDLNMRKIRNVRTYLRLLSAVNSIRTLRRLLFDAHAVFVKNENYPRIDLPILAHIEEFEFDTIDRELSCLYDSITRYAVNNQGLRRIGINIQTTDFGWLLALSTEFASRFTHIHLQLNRFNRNRFSDLCGHFAHLTSLKITVDDMFYSIVRPLHALTHLTNLISLFVHIGGSDLTPLGPARREMINFELPDVKVFTIEIASPTRNHNFFHHCALNRLFPNVQVVQVILDQACCRYCNAKSNESTPSDSIRMALEEHCARQMFRHFTHCRHLRQVCVKITGENVIGDRIREWAWNELGPFEEEEDDVVEELDEELTEDEDE